MTYQEERARTKRSGEMFLFGMLTGALVVLVALIALGKLG